MPGRGMGERLAVDPHLNSVVYFGARSGHGLWKSTDSGASFSQVTSFPNAGNFVADPSDSSGYNSDNQGLAWVTFDSNSTLVSGATSRIFIGVADKSNSVYVSEDAGKTWSAVASQPTGFLPHKGRIAPKEHALYITYSDGSGPYDGTKGSVWRYDITAKSWKDISPTPAASASYGYGGLSIDPEHPGVVMVVTLNSWYPDAIIWRSTNGGANWSTIWEYTSYPNINYYYSMDNTNAPWISNAKSLDNKNLGWMIESLEIDPFDSNHLIYGTGETVVATHNLLSWDTAHNISLKILANGIEETSVQDLLTLPGQSSSTPLLSALGDVGGFRHTSLTTSPKSWFTNPTYGTTSSLDYAGSNAKSIIRVGNAAGSADPQLAFSTDSGATWKPASGSTNGASGGRAALSAFGNAVVWSTGSGAGVLHSSYNAAFSASTGLASGAAVAADRKEDSLFYGGSGAAFFVSNSSGAAFTQTTKLGSSTTVNAIVANPAVKGDVWASTDKGLFHSTDTGRTFTQISGPTIGWAFDLGKSSANSYGYNIFGFFGVNGKNTLYVSKDVGKTWSAISDAGHGFGSAASNPVAADKDVEGRVFVGTNGRGVFVGTA
ncbi:MAG: hypothetical protein Q9160_000004 [Pyrenula sp. 1 TL-2023]